MKLNLLLAGCLAAASLTAAPNAEVADAAQRGNKTAVRSLILKKADVNAAQADGSTALHWAVQADDLELADVLLKAGAKVGTATREGVQPMQLAAVNGNTAMMERLIAAGADVNAKLSQFGDTALMMAARTGKVDAVKMLLDKGANPNAQETWGGTTALMWAISEKNSETAKLLIQRGADVNAKSKFVPSTTGRGFEGTTPVEAKDQKVTEFASGWFTPLMFAAREGDLDSAKALVAAGAKINEISGDGKDALSLAIFNGQYAVAEFLVDSKANVNQADAQGFTPLFWAVDRRNMETAPNFPWVVTRDVMPLIHKLLEAGANVNAVVNNTPRARMREGSPRIVYATAIHRAAFAGDLEVFNLLLSKGADVNIMSRDRETTLMAAAGTGFINGYSRGHSVEDRLAIVKKLVEMGADVNYADNYGITALMAAANMGEMPIIKYLVEQGADLAAHDLGKKNDGQFGSSIEPLMPVDYAIGVGTFVPNNAVIMHEDAVKYLMAEMKKRGIEHTTSECTLRGFTCSSANVDPKTATPAEVAKMRRIQRGNQVDGITGGLGSNEQDKAKK